MLHTSYYNGIIQTWDNFLSPADFSNLLPDIKTLPFFYGESDNPGEDPIGLVSHLDKETGIGKFFFSKLTQFKEISSLLYLRSYVNYFRAGEDGNYHKDNGAISFLFYLNNDWNINEGGETKFLLNPDIVEGISTVDNNYPIVISIAPIPNRLVMFGGDLIHTATSFKSRERFTLVVKFIEDNE